MNSQTRPPDGVVQIFRHLDQFVILPIHNHLSLIMGAIELTLCRQEADARLGDTVEKSYSVIKAATLQFSVFLARTLGIEKSVAVKKMSLTEQYYDQSVKSLTEGLSIPDIVNTESVPLTTVQQASIFEDLRDFTPAVINPLVVVWGRYQLAMARPELKEFNALMENARTSRDRVVKVLAGFTLRLAKHYSVTQPTDYMHLGGEQFKQMIRSGTTEEPAENGGLKANGRATTQTV